jgi:hypothetical protein
LNLERGVVPLSHLDKAEGVRARAAAEGEAIPRVHGDLELIRRRILTASSSFSSPAAALVGCPCLLALLPLLFVAL